MSGPTLEPGAVWRLWWVWTEPARLIARLVAERFLRGNPWASLGMSAARLAGHLAAGNPWGTLGLAVAVLSPVPVLAVAVALVAVEGALVAYRVARGRPHLVGFWRLAWKFHRQWPRAWADCAAKTRAVQGMDGGNRGESRAAAIRPVVDHPRMPWRFWLRYPVVTFRIGVAPGRTFDQFERIIAGLSANLPWVHSVELEYRSDRSSFGLLRVAVADVLAATAAPDWATRPARLEAVDGEGEAAA